MSSVIFKQCNSTNYQAGRAKAIAYIVIHYTANNGDTAANNANYFANNKSLSASAHYFVDESGAVYQSVKDTDTAWHCGGGLQGSGGHSFYQKCINSNSLGIEMCSRKDANGKFYIKDETVENAVRLTKELMAKYGILTSNVIRHYDVTGKICPDPFVRDGNKWEDFKKRLTESEELTMAQYDELKNDIKELADTVGIIDKQVENMANPMIYNYLDDNMPDWAKPTIRRFMDDGFLKGDEDGKLNLSEDMMRILVILDRAGAFQKSGGM